MEAAFFFCIEFSPSRVCYLLKVSESGAANKLTQVLEHLEKLAALPEHGPYDAAALARLGLVDDAGAVLDDCVVEGRRWLASRYLEYLRLVKQQASRMARPFRKDDPARAGALYDGESIL